MKSNFFNWLCDYGPKWLRDYLFKNQKVANPGERLPWLEINRKLDECIGKDDLKSAIVYAKQALQEAQRFFGKDHDKTGISHYVLGTLYVKTGQDELAQGHLHQAWKIHKGFSTDEGWTLAPSTFQTLLDFHSINKQQNTIEELLLDGIDAWERTLSQRSDIYYNILKALIKEYAHKSAHAKAEKLLVSKIELVANNYGCQNSLYGYLLGSLGLLYFSWRRPIQALAKLEEGIASLEELGIDSSADYGSFVSTLFYLYTAKGETARAGEIYCRVLDRAGSSPDIKYAEVFRNISQILWEVGDFGKAQPLLESLVEIYRAEIQKDHPDDIQVNQFAALFLETNKLTSAHRPYIEAMKGLANLYIILGEYQSAACLYSKIWKISRTISGLKSPNLSIYMMGDVGAANFGKRPYNPAWKTDPDVLNYLESLGTAARLFFAIGDYASHMEVLVAAFTGSESVLGKQHPYYLQSLNAYAQREMACGESNSAFNHYRECVQTSLAVLGHKSPVLREALFGLAALYKANGKADEALAMYHQILTTFDKKNPLDTFGAFQLNLAIAEIYASSEKKTEAIRCLLESVSLFDNLLCNIMTYGYNQRLEEYFASYQSVYHMLFSLFVEHHHDLSEFIEPIYSVLLKRKAVILEWAVQKKIHLQKSRDPALAELFSRLSKLQEDFASQLNRSRFFPLAAGQREYQASEECILYGCAREIRDLEKSLAARLPQYVITSGIRQISLPEIISNIPDGYVLIDYVYYKTFDFTSRYAAFIIRKDQPSLQVVDIGDASSVENLIISFRGQITEWGRSWLKSKNKVESKVSGTFFTDTVHTLSQALLAPVLSAISNYKNLLISADGALFELPFEILPLPGNRYLIEEYDIHYVDTVRDIVCFDDPAAAQSPSLVVADPNFDLCAGLPMQEASASASQTQSEDGPRFADRIRSYFDDDWPGFSRLKGAREEGLYVRDLLGIGTVLWQGDQALKGKLIQVKSPRILHIATHGFVFSEIKSHEELKRGPWFGQFDIPERDFSEITDNPLLRSGLLLAGANSFLRGRPAVAGAEDGILTAVDICGMDLSGTDLVVLSACSTGLGKVKPGEGVFGMRRAFVLAGARSLLVSLWSVPDQETKVLLSRFYTGLNRGISKTTALKEAKMAVINDLRKRQEADHPFTWGAFICVGNPRPIERTAQ
jgi:CHAT domain-containing protein/tetratricopeptide (TPR) repeat protein